MKTTVCALALLNGVAAFSPASSFSGSALATSARAAEGPTMKFSFGKRPAPAKQVEQAAGKAQTKGKQAIGQAKQAVEKAAPSKFSFSKAKSATKEAAAAPKQAVGKAQRAAQSATSRAPTPVKQAGTALRRAATEASTPPGEFAIEFGSDVEAPFWDPAQLAKDKPSETIEWYRAAELKHGRVAMLAALGTFVNAAGIALPDPVFQGTTKSFDALSKVAEQRPGALIQIVLAIAAVEVLTSNLPEGEYPGDLNFDPLKQLDTYERRGEGDAIRLRELKNGRLAMIGIAGMWAQEALTQQGVFEQLVTGHISPVGDGQGYF